MLTINDDPIFLAVSDVSPLVVNLDRETVVIAEPAGRLTIELSKGLDQ